MVRYAIDFDTNKMKQKVFDVLIIGGGIGGIYTALNLSDKFNIGVLCKGNITESDSYLAQGGIAASIGDDDRQLHIKDTMVAGAYKNKPDAVELLVYQSEDAIKSLIELGVQFDRDENGNLYRSFEGNHTVPRILHVNGDATGKGIMEVLLRDAKERERIQIYENAFVIDLLTDEKGCHGAIANINGEYIFFKAKYTVLATGGIGQLYKMTTNSKVLTGDGIAMAIRAGAKLNDMEFIQFHPTALYSSNANDRYFLISEAVRGEGGILRNINGERFMDKYDKRLELAPRDIVARAIYDQMEKTGSEYVYLDITSLDKDFLKARFPMIYDTCVKYGIDISKDYIPVTPVVHYFMGGIETNLKGMTNIDNLYAVGECACTGVHGANRLASNSLLEGLVFGKQVADDIKIALRRGNEPFEECNFSVKSDRETSQLDYEGLKAELKKIMNTYVGIVREMNGLKHALGIVEERISILSDVTLNIKGIEVFNMYQVARHIINAAINDKVSIGSHYLRM